MDWNNAKAYDTPQKLNLESRAMLSTDLSLCQAEDSLAVVNTWSNSGTILHEMSLNLSH
jgi:hypothetical protein